VVIDELSSLPALREALEFASSKDNGGVLVVKFGARWCPSCRDLEPIFEHLSERHPSAVFASVDVERDEAVADQCGITALPTVKLYRGFTEDRTLVCPSEAHLDEAVAAAVALAGSV